MFVAHARHPPSLCASCTGTRTFAELRVGACAKYDYNIQTDQSWCLRIRGIRCRCVRLGQAYVHLQS